MIGAHSYNRESLMTWEFEPGKLAAKDGEPYAEILARQASGFVRVELWHNGRHLTALFPYLAALWQGLIEDGLKSKHVEERPYEQNFLAWVSGTSPFESSNKSIELNQAELNADDKTVKTVDLGRLTDEERLAKFFDPEIFKRLDQMQMEQQVEHVIFTTLPVVNTTLNPLIIVATWLTEFAKKTAERIQSGYYVPSAALKADGSIEYAPVEPIPLPYKIIEAGDKLVVFTFGGKFYKCKTEGEGRIIMLPDSRLSITLKGQKSDWPNLLRNVKHLTREMYEGGWLEDLSQEWMENSKTIPENKEDSPKEAAVSEQVKESNERVVICQKGDRNQLDRLFEKYFSKEKPLNGCYIQAKRGRPVKPHQEVYRMQVLVMPTIRWNIYSTGNPEPIGSIDTLQIPKGMQVSFYTIDKDTQPKISILVSAILRKMNDWGFEWIDERPISARPANSGTAVSDNFAEKPIAEKETKARKRRISKKIQARALIFKKIKEENPALSYQGVATHANTYYSDEFEKIVEEHDVRNDYKAMGWAWPRADKIR